MFKVVKSGKLGMMVSVKIKIKCKVVEDGGEEKGYFKVKKFKKEKSSKR